MNAKQFGQHKDRNDLPGAIVTGGDYPGLGVVRSLGRRKIPVWVLCEGEQSLASASRYAARSLAWQGSDEPARVDFLVNLAREHGLAGWVLFPTTDGVVGLVARHHAALAEHFRLTTPPWEMLSWLCNKRLLRELARDLGIDQPWSICPRSPDELADLDCPFPAVVKPALREVPNPLTIKKIWRVEDRQSLLNRYDEACALLPPDLILIQELVPGWGETQFSYAALCLDGHPLAWLVARRTRQLPMDFGRFSTYVETVDEPGVIEPSVRLLRAVRYTGLVEVEFKRDPRNGQYKLLDVNTRVWGWHTLGGSAGVEFSYLLWRMAQGEQVPEARVGAGLRWRMTGRDLPVAALEILRGRLSLRGYLHSLNGYTESPIFAPDDPLPGLLDLPLLGYRIGKRLLRRRPV